MNALAQRSTRRNGITGNAVRAKLERELPSEGDDAAFRGRIGTAATLAETAASNGLDIDDLATALTLHDGHDRIAEEKGPVEVKDEEALPLVERKDIDGGARVRNDGTASDSIDQNINAATCLHSLLHHPCHVGCLQRIGHQGMGCAASAAYPV